ncbi:amino acid adenylation domain-containing protein [Micromonospora sp. NPDC000663]|uniref:amino acid adenylation domain-containing protein n=1 Tax=Micromonospora sp. NPDC000663 TaxID=3364218 RepID=UPI0036A1138C
MDSRADPAVVLAGAAAVLGHLEGETEIALTVRESGNTRTVRVPAATVHTSGALVAAARLALAVDAPQPAHDGWLLDPEAQSPHGVLSCGARPAPIPPDRLASVVEAAVDFLADPGNRDVPLSRLPLMTTDERRRLVTELNDTAVDLPALSVSQHLAELARRDPDLPAVITADGCLDHRTVQRLAGALAADLRRAGVRPGSYVHVCLPRSAELVVAWVAVLGIGAVCVPIDPGYPPERIRQMTAEPPVEHLVSTPATATVVPHRTLVPIDLDRLAGRPPQDASWTVPQQKDALSYVMHTSGSSGRPKGVAIGERGLHNLLQATARQFGLAPGGRCLQLASPGFDVAVWEILAPLYAGAAVVPFDEPGVSASALAAFVDEHRVDTVFLLASLLTHLDPEDFPTVRTVVTGGELFGPDLVRRWQPGRDLIYVYGPTEATVFQSWHRCLADATDAPPTIGRPMDNLRYHLLDPWGGRSVPGAIGELYIGGVGPGAGYLGLSAATAEKFVDLPDVDPEGRLYRTGDLASFRPDGMLDFRGRADNQVKLRGFRIELGEIETALTASAGITSAVAVVHETATERLLVAYVVPRPGSDAPDGDLLREQLASVLPYYMVPAAVVPLDEVPYTPNGKVDRRSLANRPLPRTPQAAPVAAAAAPFLDRTLAAFRDVLGTPDAGPNDDFFVLGGYSLGAAELAARLSADCEVPLRARDVFECPQPVALAARIADAASGVRAPSAGPVPMPIVDTAGLLPVQQWHWLLHQSGSDDDATYHVPALFVCTGAPAPDVLREALAALRRRHPLLQVTIGSSAGEPSVRYDAPPVPLDVVDLRDSPEPTEALREAVHDRAHHAFDLAKGPLLRVTFFRLPDGRDRLLLVAHHIICDGPALEVLARDLTALCDEAAGLRPAGLPELDRDPTRVAAAESALLDSGALDASLEHWRSRLVPAPPALELPIDRPRTGAAGRHADVVRAHVDAPVTAALRRLSRSARTDLVAPLAVAVSVALHRSTGATDICLGTAVNLRGELGLTEHVICGANSAALRVPLRPGPVADLLDAVGGRMHELVDHARYPFHRLVHRLGAPKPMYRNPYFDVWVTCYPRIDAGKPPGMTLSGAPIPLDSSPFDLSFQGCESPDGMQLLLQYDSDLYLPGTAQLLLDRVVRALVAMVDSPGRCWTDLDLRTDAELAPTAPTTFGGFRFAQS